MVSRPAALALLAVACLVVAGSAPSAGITDAGSTDSASIEDGPSPTTVTGEPVVSDYQLTLDGQPERSDVGTVGLDVAAGLRDQRSAATIRMAEIELQHDLADAETDEERFEILSDEVDRLEARIGGLANEEQALLDSYRADEISASEYLSRVAFLDARAEQYMGLAAVVGSEGERIQAAAIGQSVAQLRTRAAVVGGPVQVRVADAYTGAIGQQRVRVEASPTGYAAVFVDDDNVVRQSKRYDRLSTEGSTNDLRTTLDHVYDQYPDETDQSPSISVDGERQSGIFIVTITAAPNEQVTSYVDNRNLTIFKEVYRQPVGQLSTENVDARRGSGIDLFVNAAPSYGLLRVQTNDAESGEPIQTDVLVDGGRVGTTGPGGTFWLVDRTEEVTVTARTGPNSTVSVTV